MDNTMSKTIEEAGPILHKEMEEAYPEDYVSCGIGGEYIYVFLRRDNKDIRELLTNGYEGHPVKFTIFKQNSVTEFEKSDYVQCENNAVGPRPTKKKVAAKKSKTAKSKPAKKYIIK